MLIYVNDGKKKFLGSLCQMEGVYLMKQDENTTPYTFEKGVITCFS